MKKLLYTLLIFFSGVLLAQKNNTVKFAIYNNVIGTVSMFNLYKSSIEKINVFKTRANLPSHLKKFDYLADNGLVEIIFKKNAGYPDSLSLEMLNEQNNLPKERPVYIDGYQFNDTSTLIYNDMITTIEFKEVNGQQCIHISTLAN